MNNRPQRKNYLVDNTGGQPDNSQQSSFGRDGRDNRNGNGRDNRNGNDRNNRNDRNDGGNRFKRMGGSKFRHNDTMTDNFEFVNKLTNLVEHGDVKCTQDVKDGACDDFEKININNGGLKKTLLEGIYSNGFVEPSVIQKLMIQPIINGNDIIAQAQSGTGKTGGFMISSLQLIDESIKAPQVIIVSPTSELAFQTLSFGKKIAKKMDVDFSYSVGKTSKDKNVLEVTGDKNNEPCKVIVGTPGRLIDIIKNCNECFNNIKIVVLDECDSLLTGSFKEDLYEIFSSLPKKKDERIQICLVSATFKKEVYELSEEFLKEPSKILLKQEELTLNGIKQRYVTVNHEGEKNQMLSKMLSVINITQFIIYVNTIDKAAEVQKYLIDSDFEEEDIKIINGSLEKSERISILNNFERGNGKCLISTDLLARGINIQQLSLVINYELPRDRNLETYIHRIGRTGRFGREGLAINLIDTSEKRLQDKIQLEFKCEIKPLTPEELMQS
jgi:translation initiation factor 4A